MVLMGFSSHNILHIVLYSQFFEMSKGVSLLVIQQTNMIISSYIMLLLFQLRRRDADYLKHI
jgi:hypothetical protein